MSSATLCELKSEPAEITKYHFTFPNFPIELEADQLYIISAWNSNTHIRGLGGDDYEILNQYGTILEDGREYLLVCPKY